MLCGCIKFKLKPKAVRTSLETPSIQEELANIEWTTFVQSRALLPLKRLEMSIEDPKLLITPKREAVIELSVESQFQVL